MRSKSVLLGTIVGLAIWLYGSLKQGIAFDSTTLLTITGMSAFAAFLLFTKDDRDQRKLAEGREWDELRISSDPLVKLINSDSRITWVPSYSAPHSALFEEKWFINSKTFDYNTSIMAVKLIEPTVAGEIYRELNRVARAACGGSFVRNQMIGTLIFCADPASIDVQSLVSQHFGGRTGIIWTILIDEHNRRIIAARFNYPTRLDGIFETLLSSFETQGYQIHSEVVSNWVTRSRGKGKFGTLMELFHRDS